MLQFINKGKHNKNKDQHLTNKCRYTETKLYVTVGLHHKFIFLYFIGYIQNIYK